MERGVKFRSYGELYMTAHERLWYLAGACATLTPMALLLGVDPARVGAVFLTECALLWIWAQIGKVKL